MLAELEDQLFIRCPVHEPISMFATVHTKCLSTFYKQLFSLCTDYAVDPREVLNIYIQAFF